MLPLRAQTNAPAENGTNSPVAVTDSAQASNQSPQISIGSGGIQIHGSGKSEGFDIIPIVAMLIVFGAGVTIVAIALSFNHRRNKMLHETLRAMIDKGVPITPEFLGRSAGKSEDQPRQPRNDFRKV